MESNLPMFSATLQRLVNDGHLTAQQLALHTGYDPSTAYRWISGATEPPVGAVCLLFRNCRSVEVQSAILSVMTEGTDWAASTIPSNLDVDGDGDVSTQDALASNAEAIETLANFIRQCVGKKQTTRIDNSTLSALQGCSDAAIRAVLTSKRIFEWLHAQESKRRPARTVVSGKAVLA